MLFFKSVNFFEIVANMYLVEKIGQLILITLEGLAEREEVESIKKQLIEISDKKNSDEELVVSLSIKPAGGGESTPEMQKHILDLVEFCKTSELRLYSYRY
ncbi:MAG: hypothetical protein MUF15_04050 [Acidobacteria bacterium]|jgi:hypothetical protein|nr:hypothetical protein [Acidobacteriota bacterium]